MTSSINASTSGAGGVITTADNSGSLNIQTAGSTAINITSSQLVNVGTTTSGGQLTVKAASGQGTPLNLLTTDAGANTQVVFTGARTFQIGTGNASSGFANILYFYDGTAGAERMRITSTGNLNIGSSSASALRIYARSATSDSTSYVNYYDNSSGTVLGYISSNGAFCTGVAAASPTNSTTGAAANLYVDAAGVLLKSTSSLKYKTDVKDAYYGLSDALKLRPVTYKGNNDGDKVFGGLIAEEVDAVGLKEFVEYRNGEPDALHYGNMVSLCIKAIQELNDKVDAQAAEIAALKAGK